MFSGASLNKYFFVRAHQKCCIYQRRRRWANIYFTDDAVILCKFHLCINMVTKKRQHISLLRNVNLLIVICLLSDFCSFEQKRWTNREKTFIVEVFVEMSNLERYRSTNALILRLWGAHSKYTETLSDFNHLIYCYWSFSIFFFAMMPLLT